MNQKTTIAIVIAVGVIALVWMIWYQKNKGEREQAILKQKQLDSLAAAGADIKVGVDWGNLIQGVGSAAASAATAGIL